MADSDWLAAAFEEHREHLRVVAYRSGLPARSRFSGQSRRQLRSARLLRGSAAANSYCLTGHRLGCRGRAAQVTNASAMARSAASRPRVRRP